MTEIICGDSRIKVRNLEDESIALAFYSPPYWNFVEYEDGGGIGNKHVTYLKFLEMLKEIHKVLLPKIMAGGRLVINTANLLSRNAIEGDSVMRYPITIDVINQLQQIGFTWFDSIVWDKATLAAGSRGGKMLFGSYPYPPTPKILKNGIEDINVFVKSGKRKVSKEIKEKSKLTLEEWKEFTLGIWRIPTDRQPLHPATFPVGLASRVIRLYSFVGDTVLDPFCGIGTTGLACHYYDRDFIGIEISPKYCEYARERLNLLF